MKVSYLRRIDGKKFAGFGKILCISVFIAFIGFEIRGFLLYDPIVPYSWSAKITEYLLVNVPFDFPLSPQQSCPAYRQAIRNMGKMLPRHSYGQSEFYPYNPIDPNAEIQPVIERGVSYAEQGILKWRFKSDEPYLSYELAGNWTNYYENASDDSVSVRQLSDNLSGFIRGMESDGFEFSQPNNIPLYRYPQGLYARKIGFSKGNYLYQYTIIEDLLPYDPSLQNTQGPTERPKPIHISMNCAEYTPELREMYERYLSLDHDYGNETSVAYGGYKDNVARFTLYYPGGVLDQIQDEYYDIRQNPMKRIAVTNNFLACAPFEKLKIGNSYPCYRPDKKEFDVVRW